METGFVSTPERKYIGLPEQKYISDAGKKAPELVGRWCVLGLSGLQGSGGPE
jgi:hypothetical protein